MDWWPGLRLARRRGSGQFARACQHAGTRLTAGPSRANPKRSRRHTCSPRPAPIPATSPAPCCRSSVARRSEVDVGVPGLACTPESQVMHASVQMNPTGDVRATECPAPRDGARCRRPVCRSFADSRKPEARSWRRPTLRPDHAAPRIAVRCRAPRGARTHARRGDRATYCSCTRAYVFSACNVATPTSTKRRKRNARSALTNRDASCFMDIDPHPQRIRRRRDRLGRRPET